MSSQPTPTEPEADPLLNTEAAEIASQLVILDELLAIGMDLARRIHEHATADNIDVTARAYERVARAVRRCILLSTRLEEAKSAADRLSARQANETRARIRAQMKTAVTDAQAAPPPAPARTPRDRPDRLETIGNEPIHVIITGLCREFAHAAALIVQPLQTERPLGRRQPATPHAATRPHQRPGVRPPPSPNLKSRPPPRAPARGSG